MQEHVPLAHYSTMRLGGTARYLTELTDAAELPKLLEWAQQKNLPVIMIGMGSNIIWKDDGFAGLVIVNKLRGFEYEEIDEDVLVTVGSGEPWDGVVARCCEMGLNGIAELSLVPGTAGATPVQNVGAYGREIGDVLVSLKAFDCKTNEFVTIEADDCGFDYRTSRFKTVDRGRFFITEIVMQLSKSAPAPPYYQAVADYFLAQNLLAPSVKDVRDAVKAIRTAKLPDPSLIANNGSFFANPIVSKEEFAALPNAAEIKHWALEDGNVKLSAAWLVEAAGFKDYHDTETGMATWPKQSLVFVNEHAQKTEDLLRFKQKVVQTVKTKFGVELQQEPELLPA